MFLKAGCLLGKKISNAKYKAILNTNFFSDHYFVFGVKKKNCIKMGPAEEVRIESDTSC